MIKKIINMKNKLWYLSLVSLVFKFILLYILLNYTEFYDKNKIGLYVFSVLCSPLYVVSLLPLFSIYFIIKSKWKNWYLIIVNFLITIIILFDLLYYRSFQTLPSLYTLYQYKNLDGLSGGIFSLLHMIDIFFIIDLIILIAIQVISNKNHRYEPVNKKYFVITFGFSIVLLCLMFRPEQVKIIYNQSQFDGRIGISQLSPLGYHIVDILEITKDNKRRELTSGENIRINTVLNHKETTLPNNKYQGLFKDKNVIVIQFESLENFVINKKVNNEEISPNLNHLLEHSIYFSNFYEQVKQGTTSDAELMTNTSIYPINQGSTFFRFAHNTYNSLPLLIKNEGYKTYAFHPDPGYYWNCKEALTSLGFDKVYEKKDYQPAESILMGMNDKSFLQNVSQNLKNVQQPFYSFIVTSSSHTPFDLDKKYINLELPNNLKNTPIGNYYQSIHYSDEAVGQFIKDLEKDDLLSNSVILIYGDHEGVHKYFGQDSMVKEEQYKNEKRVPFIIYNPSLNKEEKTTIGGQIDIYPTITALLGIEQNKYIKNIIGRNLLNTQRNFAVLNNGEYISGNNETDNDKNIDISSLEASDLIIKNNYFNKQKR